MNGKSKLLFPYVFLGTETRWFTSWSQLVLDITLKQMNQKIVWVRDVIGLNFLRILSENWLCEKRSVNESIDHRWGLVQNSLWSFNVERFLKREELSYQATAHRQFPVGWPPAVTTGSDHLSWVTLWKNIKELRSRTGTLCPTCKCGKA